MQAYEPLRGTLCAWKAAQESQPTDFRLLLHSALTWKVSDVAPCDDLTDATLIVLALHCPNLRKLDTGYTYTTERGLRAIAAHCPPLLENLDVSACRVGPAIEAIARRCPRLRILIVSEVAGSAQAVLELAECCPLLEELEISQCKNVGDQEIVALVRGSPELQRLDIKTTTVTELGLRAIRYHCKNLKDIMLDEDMSPGGEVVFEYWS
jgi:hypothetical protein